MTLDSLFVKLLALSLICSIVGFRSTHQSNSNYVSKLNQSFKLFRSMKLLQFSFLSSIYSFYFTRAPFLQQSNKLIPVKESTYMKVLINLWYVITNILIITVKLLLLRIIIKNILKFNAQSNASGFIRGEEATEGEGYTQAGSTSSDQGIDSSEMSSDFEADIDLVTRNSEPPSDSNHDQGIQSDSQVIQSDRTRAEYEMSPSSAKQEPEAEPECTEERQSADRTFFQWALYCYTGGSRKQ